MCNSVVSSVSNVWMCGRYGVGCCRRCKLKGKEQSKQRVLSSGERARDWLPPSLYRAPGSTGQVLPMHLIMELQWPTPIGTVGETHTHTGEYKYIDNTGPTGQAKGTVTVLQGGEREREQ